MKFLLRALALAFMCIANLANADTLHPGWQLQAGQGITSENGQYTLTMQADGNLVYFRNSDGSVRWHTNTSGAMNSFLTMQADGNAVVYFDPPVLQPKKGEPPILAKLSFGRHPIWYSATPNNPGAYLRAENDGNLVVNASNGQALWGIGVDPATQTPDPSKPGDIVGREMENGMPYAYLGHIGFYDGSNIFEVLNDGASNAAAYNSIGTFRSRSPGPAYWGAASANIPSYFVAGCYYDYCPENSGKRTLDARTGMGHRAFQIMAIGVKYTHLAPYTRAQPRRSSTDKVVRGIYRCDTFVLDVLHENGQITDVNGWPLNVAALHPESPLRRWIDFRAGLRTGLITPRDIFQKMKNFTG